MTEKVCREIKTFVHTLNDEHRPEFLDAVLVVIYKVATEIQHPESSSSQEDAKRVLAEVFSNRCTPFRRQLAEYISTSDQIAAIQQVCDIFTVLLTTFPDCVGSLPIEELKKAAAASWADVHHVRLCQQIEELERLNSGSALVPTHMSRHCDDVDYRHIPVIPTWEEISANRRPAHLQANIIQGPYSDWSHYYDVHFRLLREDFLAPLRRGISSYLAGKIGRDLNDVTVYNSVRIAGPKFILRGICYNVQFDNSRFRKSGWEHSKRLITGSLVCLSPDGFKHIVLFATVAERSLGDLNRGMVSIRFEEDVEMHSICNMKETFVMVESNAFFEASRHILSSIQMAETETMPFTRYIIKTKCTSIKPPKYLDEATCTYNMSCIYGTKTTGTPISKVAMHTSASKAVTAMHTSTCNVDTSNPGAAVMDISDPEYGDSTSTDGNSVADTRTGQSFNILDPFQWPKGDVVEMDESQIQALKLALTQEIAVIQGPPGTGKTYVGLKVVEALLNNKHQWDPHGHSPILVICFTNHALDQFLEGILDIKLKRRGPFKPQIARVGGRCQSERVNEYNVEKFSPGDDYMDCKRKLRTKQCEFQAKMNRIQSYFNLSNGTLLTLTQLRLRGVVDNPDHIYQLAQMSRNKDERGHELEIWLGLQRKEDPPNQAKNISESARNRQPETSGSADGQNKSNVRTNNELINVQSEADMEESQRVLTGDSDFINDTENNSLNPRMELNVIQGFSSLHNKELDGERSLFEMPIEMRKDLYHSWVLKYHKLMIERKLEDLLMFSSMCKEFEALRCQSHRSILERRDVIGMTTTGAAKYQHIIHQIKPKIVIVEEAAEVLEAHIISALTAGTQHLILIGDHKQLRPKLNEYELVTNYNFDVSLFERLINNKMAHATLNIQHRMRPDIANLVRPHIYKTLHDHPSVFKYESIKGVAKNLFFITHEYLEEHNNDTISYANHHEAQFIVALCKYLLQQGYKPNQITILTPYAGQILKLRNFMPKDTFLGVRLTPVDNFQGEENDIILLSLVRSNAKKNPGFVKELNRVCVALSRAKQGFYCIGNFKMLQQSVPLWNEIVTDIDGKGHFGEGLHLYCQTHNDKVFVATLPNDFADNAPEGGCTQICGYNLPCGHSCQRKCHIDDREHLNYKCQEPCQRECPNGHPCQKYCYEDCSVCSVIVEKQMSLCNHTKKLPCHVDASSVPCEAPCLKQCKLSHPCKLPCYKPCRCDVVVRKHMPNCEHEQDIPCYQEPLEFKCQTYVVKTIPQCKHVQRMLCSENPSIFPCEESCTLPMSCGHKCPRKCKEQCPMICCEVVDDIVLDCNHSYKVECHEKLSNSKILCLQKCTKILECGHPCTEKCYIPCASVQCMIVVTKTLPCGHALERECYKFQAPDMYPCDKECRKTLACGHPCPDKCGEACSPARCPHNCSKTLLCGHMCSGTCGECYKMRMHPMCSFDIKLTPPCGHVTCTACSGLLHQCRKQYTHSCPHGKQTVQCPGVPPRCAKPCAWKCPHHKCRKLCYEQCDRGPCNRQCMRPLRCGHQCASLCGEPCLTACPDCQGLAFLRSLRGVAMKNGKQPPKQQLYIQLQTCGHIFSVDYLDEYMGRKLNVVCPRQCPDPRCSVNMCCGFRYGNAVKASLQDCSAVMNVIESHLKTMERSLFPRLDVYMANSAAPQHDTVHYELMMFKDVLGHQRHVSMDMYQFAYLLLAGCDLMAYLDRIDVKFRLEFSDACSNFINLCKTPNTKTILLSDQLTQDFTSEIYRMFLVALLHESNRSCTPSSDLRTELSIKYAGDYLRTLDLDHFQRISYQDFKKHRRSIYKVHPINATKIATETFLSTRCEWIKCDQGHYYRCPPMVKNLSCPECQNPEGLQRM